MKYSGRTTDDIYEEFADYGFDELVSDTLFNGLVTNPEYFKTGIEELFTAYREGDFDYLQDELLEFMPEDFGIPGVFNINSDYKGIKTILETDTEHIYTPSSSYCYIKCYNKFLELIGSDKVIPTKFFSPYKSSLKDIRKKIIGIMAECKEECPADANSYKGKLCTKKCNMIKRKYVDDNQLLLDEYKIYYDKDKNKVITKLLSMKKRRRIDYAIGLLYIGGGEYHAILLKNVIKQRGHILTKEMITMKLSMDRELVCDFTKNKTGLNHKTDHIAIAYDIETYTESYKKVIKKATKKTEELSELVKNLIPYALGYRVIDLNTGEYLSEYIEIIISNKGDNLFNMFFDSLGKLPYTNIQIFAHNGGRFDNIFVKTATNVTFKKAIQKGSAIKTLTVTYKQDDAVKQYTFKDTYPFVLDTLKNACMMFGTSKQKIDFDIKDKSFEWYQENINSTQPESNWREYLTADVESLAELMVKLEQSYKKFGTSMLWFTGLPGIAFYLMNNYCKGMSKLYVPKDPSMVAFIKSSMYGGRVLCFKRHYKATDDDGMIAIDYNSLYPSAMALCSFPYGQPFLFTPDNIGEFDKRAHYIILVTVLIPNIRYAYHPYKTEEGLLIYPSNTTIKGVYNDVDLREMMKDGYTVVEAHSGIYWNRSKRIFTNLINQVYDKRNYYKGLGEDHPEFNMEYIIKILINSMFGKFNETLSESTRFEDNSYDTDVMARGGTEHSYSLDNGQKEVTKKLFRPSVGKPSYIASYILAHSRSIVNEVIREIGPENIYYSDTDSIYVEKKVLTKYSLKSSKVLGGFKNDYGEGSKITEAVFLDTKRYFLKLEGVTDKSGRPIEYKAKFNGLSFKKVNTISNFDTGTLDFKTDDNKMSSIEKIYYTLLEQYNKRQYNPYQVNYDRNTVIDKKLNNKMIKEWEQENIKDMVFATEYWNRSKTSIMIEAREMKYQIDPHKRGQWVDSEYYAIGYDRNQPEHIIKQVAPIGTFRSDAELITHTIRVESNNVKLFTTRPLMYPPTSESPLLKSNILFHTCSGGKLTTNFYMCYSLVDNKLSKSDLLYIEGEIAYNVNQFGLYNKHTFDIFAYDFTCPLIGIKATKDNIDKYGENYINEDEMKRILVTINKTIPFVKK
jgi:hypothetical protein